MKATSHPSVARASLLRHAPSGATLRRAQKRRPAIRRLSPWIAALVCAATCLPGCEEGDAERTAETTLRSARVVESTPELLARAERAERAEHEEAKSTPRTTAPPEPGTRRAKTTTRRANELDRASVLPLESPGERPPRRAQGEDVPRDDDAALRPGLRADTFEAPARLVGDVSPPRGGERAPDLSSAKNVALGVGVFGVAIGAAAYAGGDGTPDERVFAVGWVSVGVAGLATAAILAALEPRSPRPVTVTVGPGALGLRGSF